MSGNVPEPDSSSPVGIILAGGKSTRLGLDKTELLFLGESLLWRTAALLRRHCESVMIVGRRPGGTCRDCKVEELPWLLDETPGRGPAGGVATALKAARRPCLVLACDLPRMDDATVRRLLHGRQDRGASTLMTTFRQVETGYVEALVAVYEPEALPLLEAAFVKRLFQLNRIFPASVRHHLPYRRHEADSFFNVNLPTDLALLRSLEFSRNENTT